jgi:DNA mismatch repair protein MSH4
MPRKKTTESKETPATTSDHAHMTSIAAVIESRSREIGFAVIHLTTLEMHLAHVSDTHSYVHLLTQIAVHEPTHILLPSTTSEGVLCEVLRDRYGTSFPIFVPRRDFNEAAGLKGVSFLATKTSQAIVPQASKIYLALLAAGALCNYVENTMQIMMLGKTMKMTVGVGEGQMFLDSGTLTSINVLPTPGNSQSADQCLFKAINYTVTQGGVRMLRRNLAAPPVDIVTIEERQHAVQSILQSPETYFSILNAFKSLPDLSTILPTLSRMPSSNIETLARHMERVIRLQRFLTGIIQLEIALEQPSSQSRLLKTIKNIIQSEDLTALAARMETILENQENMGVSTATQGTGSNNKTALSMRTRVAFAIRPGANGLLDVARQTLTENVEDIHALVNAYTDVWQLPNLKLEYTNTAGFLLTTPAFPPRAKGSHKSNRSQYDAKHFMNISPNMPDTAIILHRKGKRLQFSTSELAAYNERHKECMHEILGITFKELSIIFEGARENMDALQALNEALSTLDMILSFATCVSSSTHFVRPTFSRDGALVIKGARHPLLHMLTTSPLVPNDIFISRENRLQIVMGPNMGGKSTYLATAAQLVILAQIGCFVPAQQAHFPIFHKIFAHVNHYDSFEENASTLQKEMKEIAYILQAADQHTLVVMDEIAKGASNKDGFALAFAIAEAIANIHPTTFSLVATHHAELHVLPLVNKHARTLRVHQDDHIVKEVVRGQVAKASHYGIEAATQAGLPLSILAKAKACCRFKEEWRLSQENKVCNIQSERDLAARWFYLQHAQISPAARIHGLRELQQLAATFPRQ